MQWFRQRALWLVACLMMCASVNAMVFDNRFMPLILQPFYTQKKSIWDYSVRGIFFGAKHAIGGEEGSDDDIPLYQLFGPYNETQIDTALQTAKITSASLFPPQLQGKGSFFWQPSGKLSFQGLAFETFVNITSYSGIGGSLIGGKLDTHLELERTGNLLAPGDEQELLNVNTQIHELLGLTPPCYDNGAFGNIDLYMRFHGARDYWNKFRRIDMGANFGFLIPTGHAINTRNPAFVPLGNNHFGLYGAFDSTFELKEDYIVGLLFRVNKRFSKTSCIRMPVLTNPTNVGVDKVPHEPFNYGTLVGPARVTPGWTIVFMPRFEMTGLREGLGFNIAYVLTWHSKDKICDMRTPAQIAASAPANTCVMENLSSWGSDYISVAALYDFSYDKAHAYYHPTVSLIVDIPFSGLVSKRVFKTHGISLRIESRI